MPINMGLGKIIPVTLIYVSKTRLQVLLIEVFCCFCKQLSVWKITVIKKVEEYKLNLVHIGENPAH